MFFRALAYSVGERKWDTLKIPIVADTIHLKADCSDQTKDPTLAFEQPCAECVAVIRVGDVGPSRFRLWSDKIVLPSSAESLAVDE